MKTKLFLSISFFFFIFMFTAQAIELRVDAERVAESNRYETDLLFLGQYFDFGGTAKDMFFIGQKLNFFGALDLGLYAAGQILNVDGTAKNGLKLAAQIINIRSSVTGTNFLAAQEINCEPSSQIDGDTFITGARASLKGPIRGDLFIAAGEVQIENEVFGNVQIRAGQIQFSKNAVIHGDLSYFADQKLKPEDLEKVKGKIQFVQSNNEFLKKHPKKDHKLLPVWLLGYLKIALALIGFIVLLLPVTRTLTQKRESSGILTLFLWGLIPILIYPTLIILLTILVITFPLAVALVLAVFPLILILRTISLTIIGGVLATRLKLKTTNRFIFYLIAIIPYSILSLIPFLGFVLLFIVVSIGWGVALSWLVGKPLARRAV